MRIFIYFLLQVLVLLLSIQFVFPKNTKNLVINGDFESGNTAFYTQYRYSPGNMKPETRYTITKNPKLEYIRFDSCKNHTIGGSYFMLVNGCDTADLVVWRETFTGIEKYQTYLLSFWAMSIDTINPPILKIFINGKELTNSPMYVPPEKCLWTEYYNYWNSENADTAEITIVDDLKRLQGNDFGLDDISFMSECIVSCSAGSSAHICKGGSAQIGFDAKTNMPPLKYDWSPKYGLSAYDILKPMAGPDSTTIYHLTVTDSLGCKSFDSVEVIVESIPDSTIRTQNNSNYICPCQPTILYAPSGVDFVWSTGETTSSVTVNRPGVYSVKTYNAYGCISNASIEIKNYDNKTIIKIDSSAVNIGENFSLPIIITSEIDKKICGDYKISIDLSYNSSIMGPADKNFTKTISNGTETIHLIDIPTDSLKNIRFQSALGNDSCSAVIISGLRFSCPDIIFSDTGGKICLKNICHEPTNRLFVDLGKTEIAISENGPFSGNAIFKIIIGDVDFYSLNIYNIYGQKVVEAGTRYYTPGGYAISTNLSGLSSGFYFAVLSSAGITKVCRFEIVN